MMTMPCCVPRLVVGVFVCAGLVFAASPASAAGRAQASGVSTTLLVPIVLSSQGLGGSFNVSEMTLTNRGTSDSAVTFSYTAAFGGGGGTATDTLLAGRQKIVPDALAYLRTLNAAITPETGDRGGTLRVTFSGLGTEGDAAITVRTLSPSGNGRAGVAYRGIPISSALTGTAYLCGLRQDGTDRSNVAVLNAGTAADGDVTLRLTVISGDPASPGRYPLPDVTLAPGGFRQLSGILGMVGTGSNGAVPNGYVQIERVAGAAPYYAYAVINDQGTSDGSFISPVAASSFSGVSNLAVPVIVETASYASELILANVGTAVKSLRFTYVASALLGGTATFSVDIGPSEQKCIPDLVQYLRENGTPGIGPSGPDVVGTLFANVLAGDAAGLFLGARTSTRGPGRYGVFYEAKAKGSGDVSQAWLYGLQQNAETRTNLALVNTSEAGGAAETLRVELFDGGTGTKVATLEGDATTVAARGFRQLGSVLGTYAPGTANGYARITRTAGSGPFLIYAVVTDGGRPGERTGDGAFVEMRDDSAMAPSEPDFRLSVVPPSSLQAGTSGTAMVSAVRTGGHKAAIALHLLPNTQGISGAGTIASSDSSGALTISVPSSVFAGTYTVTMSGSDGTVTRNADLLVSIVARASTSIDSPFGFHPAAVGKPGYSGNGHGDAQNLGVKWTREGIYAYWFIVQPDISRPAYDFSQYDAQWRQVPIGMNILGNIAPQGPKDEGRCLPHSYLPVDEGKYTDFVKAVVRRYDGDGIEDMPELAVPIRTWQVGNEPTSTRSGFPDLQRMTYAAIKEVCPGCTVLIGGVPGMPPAADYNSNFDAHYKPILDALAGKSVDVMDFHWYGAATGDYRGAREAYDHIRAVLKADGFSEIPFWIAEMGAYSGDPVPASISNPKLDYPFQTERQQALDYFKRFVYPLSFGVKKVFPAFGLMEGFKYDGGYFDLTGLIYDGWGPGDLGLGVKKLGYYTYKKMTEVLEGADWSLTEVIREDGDVFITRFTKNGHSIYAAWWDYFVDPSYTPGKKIKVSLPGVRSTWAVITEVVPRFDAGKEVADYASGFNTATSAVSNGILVLDLGDSPVLVEELPAATAARLALFSSPPTKLAD